METFEKIEENYKEIAEDLAKKWKQINPETIKLVLKNHPKLFSETEQEILKQVVISEKKIKTATNNGNFTFNTKQNTGKILKKAIEKSQKYYKDLSEVGAQLKTHKSGEINGEWLKRIASYDLIGELPDSVKKKLKEKNILIPYTTKSTGIERHEARWNRKLFETDKAIELYGKCPTMKEDWEVYNWIKNVKLNFTAGKLTKERIEKIRNLESKHNIKILPPTQNNQQHS